MGRKKDKKRTLEVSVSDTWRKTIEEVKTLVFCVGCEDDT